MRWLLLATRTPISTTCMMFVLSTGLAADLVTLQCKVCPLHGARNTFCSAPCETTGSASMGSVQMSRCMGTILKPSLDAAQSVCQQDTHHTNKT